MKVVVLATRAICKCSTTCSERLNTGGIRLTPTRFYIECVYRGISCLLSELAEQTAFPDGGSSAEGSMEGRHPTRLRSPASSHFWSDTSTSTTWLMSFFERS